MAANGPFLERCGPGFATSTRIVGDVPGLAEHFQYCRLTCGKLNRTMHAAMLAFFLHAHRMHGGEAALVLLYHTVRRDLPLVLSRADGRGLREPRLLVGLRLHPVPIPPGAAGRLRDLRRRPSASGLAVPQHRRHQGQPGRPAHHRGRDQRPAAVSRRLRHGRRPLQRPREPDLWSRAAHRDTGVQAWLQHS